MTSSCAITGHRPMRFSFGYDEDDEQCHLFKEALASQIRQLILRGVSAFYTGMALGVDQWAAVSVLEEKKLHLSLRLIAVLPCETQANKWTPEQRNRYFDILAKCDEVIILNGDYTPTCMTERNEYLVDHTDHLLAVYDGKKDGGTAHTVRYARHKKRRITFIHPDTMEVIIESPKPTS